MGEAKTGSLRMSFDSRVKLEFHGAKVSSDAGLLAYLELDEALGLTAMADEYLKDTRPGSNVQHRMIPLLRQSVHGRLAAPASAQGRVLEVLECVGCERS